MRQKLPERYESMGGSRLAKVAIIGLLVFLSVLGLAPLIAFGLVTGDPMFHYVTAGMVPLLALLYVFSSAFLVWRNRRGINRKALESWKRPGWEVVLPTWRNPFLLPALIGREDGMAARVTLTPVTRRSAAQAAVKLQPRLDHALVEAQNKRSAWKWPSGSYLALYVDLALPSSIKWGAVCRTWLAEKTSGLTGGTVLATGDDEFDRDFLVVAGEGERPRFGGAKLDALRNLLSISAPYSAIFRVHERGATLQTVYRRDMEGKEIETVLQTMAAFKD